MRRAGPMARPFSPSSSLSPATADALAASPLSTLPLAHRIPSQNSPGFSFSIEPSPSSPPIPLLTSQFPRLSIPPANRSNVSFHFVRCFLSASSFHVFSSSFFYVISRSVLSNHPSLFPSCPSFVSLIDESPYTEKISELYLSTEFLFFFLPSPLIHPPSLDTSLDPTNIFFFSIILFYTEFS